MELPLLIIAIVAGTELDSIKSFSSPTGTTPDETKDFTWTSGKLTSIIEKGDNGAPYTRTRTFTYVSGNISSMSVVYTQGARESGEIESIDNFVVSNGDITSGTIHATGEVYDNQTANIAYETTASNPYKGLYNETEDPLTIFSAHNPTSVTAGTSPLVVTVFTRSYTYSDGRVATSAESANGDNTAKTLTYTCK